MAFGNNMLKERMRRGWTKEEAGRRTGTRGANIYYYEKTECFPRMNILKKILEVYEIPRESLFEFLFGNFKK